jgi:hypothetical protein
MGTGSAAKNKPSKWQLDDIIFFLDMVVCLRKTVRYFFSKLIAIRNKMFCFQ